MKREQFSKRFDVQVRHWMNWREILVKENALAFQVTIDCRHCYTCQKREEQVRRIMREGEKPPYSFALIDGQLYLILPLAEGEDPVTVLNQVVGLGVYT